MRIGKPWIIAYALLACITGARAESQPAPDADADKYQAKYVACMHKAAEEVRADITKKGASDGSRLLSAIDSCDQMHNAEMLAIGAHMDCSDQARWLRAFTIVLGTPSDVALRVYDEFCPARK